jgi:ribosomal protein S12 methylthiotransferase accessory factor
VTDVTRLDCLGIPVFASIRPRGRTLHVHAGKGLSPEDARVGACMEALELSVCEQASGQVVPKRVRWGELERCWQGQWSLGDLAPRRDRRLDRRRSTLSLDCEDLRTGAPVPMPAGLILPFQPVDGSSAALPWCSNGLASGNDVAEATLHALFEVLERDTRTLNRASDSSCLLPAQQMPEPFAEMATRWPGVGVELIVRYLPNAFALPCFEAYIHDAGSTDVDLCGGAGLHWDKGIALTRAVTEAAQSRLTNIHGGRDDLPRNYVRHEPANQLRSALAQNTLLQRLRDGGRAVTWAAIPQLPGLPRATLLRRVMARIATQGFPHVLRRDLSKDIGMQDLSVVKLLVPGAENGISEPTRIGPRLLRRLMHGT